MSRPDAYDVDSEGSTGGLPSAHISLQQHRALRHLRGKEDFSRLAAFSICLCADGVYIPATGVLPRVLEPRRSRDQKRQSQITTSRHLAFRIDLVATCHRREAGILRQQAQTVTKVLITTSSFSFIREPS